MADDEAIQEIVAIMTEIKIKLHEYETTIESLREMNNLLKTENEYKQTIIDGLINRTQ